MGEPFYRPTIAEVDLDALAYNLSLFRKKIPNNIELMVVVKADAYGHGAVPVVKHLKTLGVSYFAVAFLDEAIELRQEGIQEPILVLGYTPESAIETAYKYNVDITIFAKEAVDQIHLIGNNLRKKMNVHIKVDTGMGRLGIFPNDLKSFINYLQKTPWIKLEGINTHFATADEKDKTFTLKQYDKFIQAINQLEIIKDIPFIHVSNSAAMIDLPNLNQTMSRLGISLYGQLPSNDVNLLANELKPVMSIKTKVVYIKKIIPGETVSYGATFTAKRDTLVATLPIGYADGLTRKLSNKGHVLVHGKRAPIIGTVCMDQTMIDITDIPMTNVGDEVVIYGFQGNQYVSFDENAQLLDTINYELLTLLSKRIPRVYRKNGEIVEVINNLTK